MQYKLSIIIIGRNEEFMGRTIEDVLSHTGEQTEIIVVLDGYLPNPPLKSNPRVRVIYNPEAVGQRGAVNQGVKLSNSKYVLKLDAHCAVDDDFDIKMIKAMEELGDDTTLIPLMRNLHAFDWICENGHRRYQSPSGVCETCGKETKKDVCWIAKKSPATFTFRFDKTLHFQYYGELAKRPENIKGALKLDGTYDTNYRETLSIQGSCYMATREKYLELDLTSEEFNSWGQNGVEVACKTWLSGGRVISNLNTWYAHMFRTRGGDFGFPYSNPQAKVNENRELSRELFQKDKWPKAIHKFQWLLDKFNPPDWALTKGMCYYSDNALDGTPIGEEVKRRLKKIAKDKNMKITTACLKKIDLGDKNVHFPTMKRGIYTMFKQILASLENSSDDIVFLCEADVLYDASHFDFTPERNDIYYYNQNNWQLRVDDGFAVYFDCKRVSQCCAYRETLIKHYRKRLELVEKNGFSYAMGFEAGSHNRPERVDDVKSDIWRSDVPNIDLAHGKNVTSRKWKTQDFRSQRNCQNWKEGYEIPSWGDTKELIKILK